MFGLEKLFDRTNYNSLVPELVEDYNKHRPMGAQKYLCYAPLKSIYFGHEGKAVACCYNRNHILGTYPQQSIKQIWFGEEADKLRKYIKHNDLSLGCLGCKNHIVARNYNAVKTIQYDERTLNKNKYPSVMEFELSNVCNLECVMCSGQFSSLIRAKREKLPPLPIPYDIKFVDQLEEFIPYLDEVKFYGGEPFLIELYMEIWERIMKINPKVRISVQTNATTLNNRVKEIMQKVDFHINISFDSLKKEVYESIRKNADFDRVMENIQYFRNYCKERNTFLGISVCAMQQNRFELPDFINFCNQMEVPVYFHTVVFPESSSIRALTQTEISDTIDYLQKFDFPKETQVQKKNHAHYFDFINHVREWRVKSTERVDVNQLMTFENFEKMLISKILNDSTATEEYRTEKAKRIQKVLDGMKANLPPDFMEKSFHKYNPNDPSFWDSVAFHLENLSLDEIIEKSKQAASN